MSIIWKCSCGWKGDKPKLKPTHRFIGCKEDKKDVPLVECCPKCEELVNY